MEIELTEEECFEEEIIQLNYKNEREKPLNIHYLENNLNINLFARGMLIDWLYSLNVTQKMKDETVFLAVAILDRFVAASTLKINKDNFQLIGCACYMIASKFEDIFHVFPSDLVYKSDNCFSKDDLISVESVVLATLKFDLVYAHSLVFLNIYFHQIKIFTTSQRAFCRKYLDKSLLCLDLLEFPSLLASCIIFVALKHFSKNKYWRYFFATKYTDEDLQLMETKMKHSHSLIHKKFQSINKRYN